MSDKHIRSIAKSLSWRICGSILTSIIVFTFTGKWTLSFTVGAADFILKILAFYFHERMWFIIKWGKREVKPQLLEEWQNK